MPDATKKRTPLSAAKRLAFTGVMLLIPVVFFVLLEAGLRMGGYGDDYPLFVPVPEKPEYLYQNREVARRYFAGQATIPSSLIDFFPVRKAPGTFRIFVQGGSSAAGYPFYYGASFSRMLDQRLRQTFPDRPIEVVNTAMAAVNSYTLLDLADEIIAQEPDLVLVYAGHNEYYGALGVGSSEGLGGFRFLTRAYLSLMEWRTVQAVRNGLARGVALFGGRGAGERPSSTLMERMVGEQSIPYGSPLYEMGVAQFKANLSDLLARYEAAGIPVLVGTLAANERDHAPFISGLADGVDAAAWKNHMAAGRAAAVRGDTTAALAAYDQALALDSLSADAFYAKARLLDGLGRYADARAAYLAAKDRDQLRFRAPEAMNDVIREVAAHYGAGVVATHEALAAASPTGIIGQSLMMEHLHPNVDGYFLLADAFYGAMRTKGYIGGWERAVPAAQARREVLLTPVDSLVGVYRIRQLMAAWPFQPPGVVDRSLLDIEPANPVEEIALELYRSKVSWRAANEALRQYYESQGDYHRALQAALVHIQSYPLLAQPYLVAGNILVRQYRYDDALVYFDAANEREETSVGHQMSGSILLQRGEYEAAIDHLERAVALDGRNVTALYNLGGAYAGLEQYARARETAERLLTIAPNHGDGRRFLASLPR